MASVVASPERGAILITKVARIPLIVTPTPVPRVLAKDFIFAPATNTMVSAVERIETTTADNNGLTPFSIEGINIKDIKSVADNMGWLTWSDLYKDILRGIINNASE